VENIVSEYDRKIRLPCTLYKQLRSAETKLRTLAQLSMTTLRLISSIVAGLNCHCIVHYNIVLSSNCKLLLCFRAAHDWTENWISRAARVLLFIILYCNIIICKIRVIPLNHWRFNRPLRHLNQLRPGSIILSSIV